MSKVIRDNLWRPVYREDRDNWTLMKASSGGSRSVGGFDTEKEALDEMARWGDENGYCMECSQPIKDGRCLYGEGLCFTCVFWIEKLDRGDDPRSVRVNGEHYWVGDEDENGLRGFGGRRWNIEFFDGRNVTTTNLWAQGQIPEWFRNRLPDNAEFVHG